MAQTKNNARIQLAGLSSPEIIMINGSKICDLRAPNWTRFNGQTQVSSLQLNLRPPLWCKLSFLKLPRNLSSCRPKRWLCFYPPNLLASENWNEERRAANKCSGILGRRNPVYFRNKTRMNPLKPLGSVATLRGRHQLASSISRLDEREH